MRDVRAEVSLKGRAPPCGYGKHQYRGVEIDGSDLHTRLPVTSIRARWHLRSMVQGFENTPLAQPQSFWPK